MLFDPEITPLELPELLPTQMLLDPVITPVVL
jgi:hypothetical protein